MTHRFLRKKSYLDTHSQTSQLKRCLSAWDLTLLGIGAIIGAGIFVLTGIAAATEAGPAIVIAFVLAGFACGFSALSYAELAASIGGCGSAYNYAYVAFGELPAWIIGWDLLLEYALSVSAVAVGWSHYFNTILESFSLHIPFYLLHSPSDGGILNLPALFIVLFIMILSIVGIKISAHFNTVMVTIKIAVIILFIAIAVQNINIHYWQPFLPFGWHGILGGAGLIFFAYIGFDAVSTTAEEVINPQRNLPIGIITSLAICTFLYILVSGLLTGIVPYHLLNVSSPISYALLQIGYHFAAATVAVGAIAGLTTVILVMYYGLTRVFLAMARDKLLPNQLATINSTTHTPVRIIVITGSIMGIFSAFIPISELAQLVNIGTLFAFAIVCGGVIVLRFTNPELKRPFKTPLFPLIPALGVISCLYLTAGLPTLTWLRFGVWMIAGIVIYFCYGQFKNTT